MKHYFYRKYVKRILDIIISLTGMILLSWLILIVWLLVRIKHGSPTVFKQQRPGYREKIFCLYKFRTMTNEKDENGNLLPDDARLTRFGRFLRATSLDELPQLWNIFKGDMSIIGPRPLLVSYLDKYSERQHRRHDVRPGLFGLAGVNGRNAQSWESKFEYDIEYVENVSFVLDLKIFLKCIVVVFKKEGISEDGVATATEFKGIENNE